MRSYSDKVYEAVSISPAAIVSHLDIDEYRLR